MIEPWHIAFPQVFDGQRIAYEYHAGVTAEWLAVLVPSTQGLFEPPVLNYLSRYFMGLGFSVLWLDCRFMNGPEWDALPLQEQAKTMSDYGTSLGHLLKSLVNYKAISFASFCTTTLFAHGALETIGCKDLLQSIWMSTPAHFPWDRPLLPEVHSLWISGREDPQLSMDIMREQVGDRLFLAGVGPDLDVSGDIIKSIKATEQIMQKITRWQSQIHTQKGSRTDVT